MKLFALADLHLNLSVPAKDMGVYGAKWHHYVQRIAENWKARVGPEDWVLIPGDICWAMRAEQAQIDLNWISELPGKKILSRGNHDYWWPSKSKIKSLFPETMFSAERELVEISPSIAVTGTRLWDSPEYHFYDVIDWQPKGSKSPDPEPIDPALFDRELLRLEEALKLFKPQHTTRLVMVHYPPIGLDLAPSRASRLLEKYGVDLCVFGHLHSLFPGRADFGTARGVCYEMVACDYLDCSPKLLLEF